MPVCETKYFGTLEYAESSTLDFPRGLPGFEGERGFVVIDHPATKPLVYVQSLTNAGLCFVAVPVQAVVPDYELEIADEERDVIGIDCSAPVRVGTDLLCLTLISTRETGTTANLMAPIIASLQTRKAVQSLGGAGRYSHQHRIES